MPAERAQLVIDPVDGESITEPVCDYDELDEAVTQVLGRVSEHEPTTLTVDPFAAALVDCCDCEVVKFTDYVRLTRA